jgi:CheY-like chemotaxis protein
MNESATKDGVGPGFTLLNDQPYSGADDPLGFERAVDGIETLILASRRSTPFTLGIEGTWGAGKSTLMSALRGRLAERPEITVAQFNAWTAEDGRVLEGFVKTVLNEIDPSVLRRVLRNELALNWARALVTLVAGPVGMSNAVDKIWDRVAADPRARNELRNLVEAAVKAWRDKMPELGDSRLLCVFVDDLDRCYPKVVLEVLEAMKLYLDVPGIVFVVGYDEDIVTDVVLRDKGYGDKTTARNYLEKFIQISYRIPRAEESQSETLIKALLQASGTARLIGETERRLILEGSSSNPRRIKRFINGFILVYELDPRWREFRPQSLVRILLLQMYFPEFARLLEDSSERDPAEEFLEYQEAWAILRREGSEEGQRKVVDKALFSHGLPTSEEGAGKSASQLLEMLEKNVPPVYPALASRADFISLVRSLFDSEDWGDLRKAFSGGALAQLVSAEIEEPIFGEGKYSGLRVLWVDDEMEGNRDLVATMTGLGAAMTIADNTEGMFAALAAGAFDVLISDIARGGDPEAGLTALERLREERPEDIPETVIFYAGRSTPVREERANALRAEIVVDPQVLLDYMTVLASRRS